MKTTINIIGTIAIVALLAFPHIDIDIPISGGESPLAEAFATQLATDLNAIAGGVGEKSPAEIDKAIENAFDRAADAADRELDKSIQVLADDDYEGLKDTLRDAAEELE